MYNWETAKKVCPKGWHLPSDSDWMVLNVFLGETNAGLKLKSKNNWEINKDDVYQVTGNNADEGTNSSGFSALPAGYLNGIYNEMGKTTHFWSYSSVSNELGNRWILSYNYSHLYMVKVSDYPGYSVRCIKD